MKKDRNFHREKIAAAMGKTVLAIIETGRLLIAAKADLEHGEFIPMVEEDLRMSIRTVDRLMAVAGHQVLSNWTKWSNLPPSWTTLYQLTRIPDKALEKALGDGTIYPEITSKEVMDLIPRKKPKPDPEPDDDEDDDEDGEDDQPNDDDDDDDDDSDPGDGPREFWQRCFENRVSTVLAMRAFWDKEYPEWRTYDVPTTMITLGKDLIDELKLVIAMLEGRK